MPPLDFNSPEIQRALYAVFIPAAAALVLWLVLLPAGARGRAGTKTRRAASLVVPLASLIGLALLIVQPFHATADPQGFASVMSKGDRDEYWQTWMWLLPAVAGALLVWPIVTWFFPEGRGRRWLFAAAAGLATIATTGVCVALARYDIQPAVYVWLGPLAGLAAFLLYRPAVDDHAFGRIDLAILAVAGVASLPILVLTGWHTAAMVAAVVVMPTVVAAIVSLASYGGRFANVTDGLAAGGMVTVPVLVATAGVGWLNAYDLTWLYAVALALPPIGAIAGIWVLRAPRTTALLAVLLLSAAGVVAALSQADEEPIIGRDLLNFEADSQADDSAEAYGW